LGHVSGLGIPKTWTRAIGISDELYHSGAVYGGGFFGIVTLIGMFILTTRRFSHRTVRMYWSKSDMIVNCLFVFIVCIGVDSSIAAVHVVAAVDYRGDLSICFRSLFTVSPSLEIMSVVPIAFKVHVQTDFLIFAIGAF